MQIGRLLLSLAPILCTHGQIPSPNAAEQQEIIARMREAATTYNDRLQDFLGNQTMTRSASDSGKRWKVLETQESDLSYIGHKVAYKLLKVNGKTTDLDKAVKRGYFLFSGEFAALRWAFDPKAKAEFDWDHGELSEGQRLCVFRYRVAQAETNFVFYSDGDKTPAGHHGLVYADCETGVIMRFHLETEPAAVRRGGRDIPLGYELNVRYAFTAIAGQEFLLPQVAEETSLFNTRRTRAEVKFQQYRKYDSNSTITFGDR